MSIVSPEDIREILPHEPSAHIVDVVDVEGDVIPEDALTINFDPRTEEEKLEDLADQLEAEELKYEIPTDGSQHLTQEDLERIEKYTKGYDELYDSIEDKYNSAADVHAAVQKDQDYPVKPDVFRADLIKARMKELNKSLGRKAAQSAK